MDKQCGPRSDGSKRFMLFVKKASKIFQQTTKSKRFIAVIGHLRDKRLRVYLYLIIFIWVSISSDIRGSVKNN